MGPRIRWTLLCALAVTALAGCGSDGGSGSGGMVGAAGSGGMVGAAGRGGTSGAAGTGGSDRATCSDGELNGSETAVDCGGDECDACPQGERCRIDDDCETGLCADGVCAEPVACASLADGTECDDDGNTCTIDECLGGTCVHQPRPIGSVCRESAGSCDEAETCDGAGNPCPPDSVASNVTVCRTSAGLCDEAETCDGINAECPPDELVEAGGACGLAPGPCALAPRCSGDSAECPPSELLPAGTECRPAMDLCDVAAVCSGESAECPANGFRAAGTECRPAEGVCDLPDQCTGASAVCPDQVVPAGGSECRPAVGSCDIGEACDGVAKTCPVDALRPRLWQCRASSNICDAPEFCDGEIGVCPADVARPDGTVCGAGAACINPSVCSAGTCLQGTAKAPATVCRDADPDNPCDQAETCGPRFRPGWPACPSDVALPNGSDCVLDGVPGTCQSGQCLGFCNYTVDCPDGYVCNNNRCEPPAAGQFGAACTGDGGNGGCAPGLVCCAYMELDDGIQAGGAPINIGGRCAECCRDLGDYGCGGGAICCDGQCYSPDSSIEHCGGCAYDPGGANCKELLNGCSPKVLGCSFGTCQLSRQDCGTKAVCTMPPRTDPECLADLFCLAHSIAPECLEPPFDDCAWSCTTVVLEACDYQVDALCDDDSDCCPGMRCLSNYQQSCPYCSVEATCQFVD